MPLIQSSFPLNSSMVSGRDQYENTSSTNIVMFCAKEISVFSLAFSNFFVNMTSEFARQ